MINYNVVLSMREMLNRVNNNNKKEDECKTSVVKSSKKINKKKTMEREPSYVRRFFFTT